MIQSSLPLVFSVPSAKENSKNRYAVMFDGSRWSCTCEFYRRNGRDCRHILSKRLETKGESVFGGVTLEPLLDEVRLSGQLRRVFSLMCDGEWRTLGEIHVANLVNHDVCDSEAGISARLRDFKKVKFGKHLVDKRRRGDAVRGLWEYRLVVNEKVKVNIEG